MAQEAKRVLIVDDNRIDRMVLKNILDKMFEVVEADNGSKAFEYISEKGDSLDAILLDLSMPHIDGFDVLSFMKEKGLDDIPVFVVTTESTKKNVTRAFQYNICGFFKKPFVHEEILERLKLRMGVVPEYNLTRKALLETMKYIRDLETVYKAYLDNFEKSDARYRRRSDLMQVMLNAYRRTEHGKDLNPDAITLISKAAYFCDIGEMLIPDGKQKDYMASSPRSREMEEQHTILGSELIKLNRSPDCSYFVDICSSMCLHHHERYDGGGYPYGIKGKGNTIYNQICRVLDELDEKRSKLYNGKAKPIKFIIGYLAHDGMGVASKEVYDLLKECEQVFADYYR